MQYNHSAQKTKLLQQESVELEWAYPPSSSDSATYSLCDVRQATSPFKSSLMQ